MKGKYLVVMLVCVAVFLLSNVEANAMPEFTTGLAQEYVYCRMYDNVSNLTEYFKSVLDRLYAGEGGEGTAISSHEALQNLLGGDAEGHYHDGLQLRRHHRHAPLPRGRSALRLGGGTRAHQDSKQPASYERAGGRKHFCHH